jgi:hypothetical protein
MSKYSSEGYEMILKRKHNPWPYYIAGAVWLVYALLFPMYRIWDFIIAAAITFAAFFACRAWLFRPYDIWVKAPVAQFETGDEAADEVLSQGREYLRRLRAGRGEIENLMVRDKLEKIAGAVQSILAYVSENPKKAIRIRNFIDYYLPTVVKLVEKYAELERQSIRGENIAQSLKDIGSILDTIDLAFKKQLDALYDDTALDIITDVEVLEKMLAGEGLAGGIYEKRND